MVRRKKSSDKNNIKNDSLISQAISNNLTKSNEKMLKINIKLK